MESARKIFVLFLVFVLLFMFLATALVHALDLCGNYMILPKSDSIYDSMNINNDGKLSLSNKSESKVLRWSMTSDNRILFIGGLGFYLSMKDGYIILTPAFEVDSPNKIIYAMRTTD